ncbi:polyprenyl synthetase family protein [Streptomyces sp. NPDC012794]|uniref:polyprenyl synthetase family protein n=1 Tax=Streptomyces sp. NPDC012794 TaxID=3364850 RepID=UPI0036B1167C
MLPFGSARMSAGVETWHLTGHLRDEDGEAHTWSAGVLRHHDTQDPAAGPGHCVYVAHHGPAGLSYGTWITPSALKALRQAISSDQSMDPRVRAAMTEALAQGPFLPDRLLPGPVTEKSGTLDLTAGEVMALRRKGDGSFHLVFKEQAHFDLLLTPLKPVVPQFDCAPPITEGPAGLTSSVLPRLEACGTLLTSDGTAKRVAGRAWFQHGWGAIPTGGAQTLGPSNLDWGWAGLHLDNGWDISVLHMSTGGSSSVACPSVLARAIAVAPDGSVSHHDLTWQPTRHWTSLATYNTYPTAVRVHVPALDLDVELTAPAAAREIRTLTVGRGFWESPATARGTMQGASVSAMAVLKTLPDNTIGDIERYMRRSHGIARAEAAAVYPATPADTVGVDLLSGTHDGTLLDATAHARLHEALAAPVLHLLNTSGRSWRPFVATSVLCLLDTDPEPYRPLTAVTEILHTAALIIDDIQDGSPTRRGLPSVHEVFGIPAAITAGTLGYYTFDPLLQRVPQADAATMLRIYQVYLRAMRAAHAGQALDLAGYRTTFDSAATSGDPGALLEQIRTTHRLKTGMLVRSTAEITAILAGADDAQLTAICRYFETIGVAYQISDDVADLYGMSTADDYRQGIFVRTPARDLANGTVTYPVAHALALLDADDRRRLATALHARTEADAAQAAELLMDSGALEVCLTEARDLVDRAWGALDPLLPQTLHKAMVRALGWYTAQRGPGNDHIPTERPTPGSGCA